MTFPDIKGIREAFTQVPLLRETTIQQALESVGKALPPDRTQRLVDRLQVAFESYFRSRLWQLWAAQAPASKTVAELRKVTGAVERLTRHLEISDGIDKFPKLLQTVLTFHANEHGRDIGGYPNLSPMRWNPANGGTLAKLRPLDYQGDVKIQECLESVLLLQSLLKRALAYERRKVSTGKSSKRHEGDEEMPALFNTLNGIWADAFDELPGTTWNAYAGGKGDAGGPYVQFLLTLFLALRKELPATLVAKYPKLRAGLPATANAVRGRFKASGAPKLKRLARHMA